MHPYRDSATLPERKKRRSSPVEDLILYGLLVVIGAIPVVIALVQDTALGVNASLGLIMIGAGMTGAIAHAWQLISSSRAGVR